MSVASVRPRTNGSPRKVPRPAEVPPPEPPPNAERALPPPNDLDAERAVLSAVLIDPSALAQVRLSLAVEDLYLPAHQRIYRAACTLDDAGAAVDAVTIAHELTRAGRLAEVGGPLALGEMIDASPAVGNVAAHARIVAEHARARRELEAAQRLVAGIRTGDADLVAQARAELAATHPAEPETPTPPELSPSGIVAAWRTEGPLLRVPTGIAPLDRMCRGGLPVPWRVILVGAPSAGKTAVAVIICYLLASAAFDAGLCVGILAVDEEPEDITVRLAQIAGFSVAQLELRDPDVLGDVQAALAGLRVRFYDSTHTIEAAATDLAEWCRVQQRRGMLVIDSVQAATSAQASPAKSPREHVEGNVRAIRWAVSHHRLLVIATSEANRGSYRTDDAGETTNDLAAGAESRAIEFGAQTQLMLRTPKDHPDVIHVRVAKNRRADRGEFWLRLDRDRHGVSECPDPDADPATVHDRQEQRRAGVRAEVFRDAEALAALLVRHPHGLGKRELRAALKAAGNKWGVERLDAARHALGAGHKGVRLVEEPDDKRVVSRLVPDTGSEGS